MEEELEERGGLTPRCGEEEGRGRFAMRGFALAEEGL